MIRVLVVVLGVLLGSVCWGQSAPTVIAMAPSDGTAGVDVMSTVVITFSQAMDPITTDAAISSVPAIQGEFRWNGSQLTIHPGARLRDATVYTLTIAATAQDAAGTPLGGPVTSAFTTTTLLASGTPLPGGPFTSLIHLGGPTDHVTGQPGAGQALVWDHFLSSGLAHEQCQQPTVGLPVTLSVSTTSTPMVWQALTQPDGLWATDSSSSLVDYYDLYLIVPSDRPAEVVTSLNGSCNVWLDASPLPIFSGGSGTSASVGLSAGLHLLTIKDTGASSAGSMQIGLTDTSGQSFSDLRQTTIDAIPPVVSVSYPAAGATGVSGTDDVMIEFSEPMQTGIPISSLVSISGNPVGSWTWTDPIQLCFRPATPLAAGTTYVVMLTPSQTLDLAGNYLAGPNTISFTTSPAGPAPVPTALSPAGAVFGAPVSCVLSATGLNSHLVYPVGAIPFQGHRYGYQRAPLEYFAAEAFCEAHGGHLSTITSAEEDNLVWQLAGRVDSYIGLHADNPDEIFGWIDNEPLTYTNWAQGEPNNFDGDLENKCAYFYGLQWNSVGDGSSTYVCESDTGQGPSIQLSAHGLPSIPALVTATSVSGATCAFDLTNAAPGVYDLIITNPDATTGTLPGAFTVQRLAGPTVTATAGSVSIRVDWTPLNSGSAVIIRRGAATSPTAPIDGTACVLGQTIGAGTVVALTSLASALDAPLTPSTAYVYDVYQCSTAFSYSQPGTVAVTTLAVVQPSLISVSPQVVQPVAGVSLDLSGSGFDGGEVPIVPGAQIIGAHAYLVVTTSVTWSQAQADAEAQGGTLPLIASAADNQTVFQAIGGHDSWIGVDDPTATGNFELVDGSSLAYSNWFPGEPNNLGQETVTEIYGSTGQWNNMPPTNTLPYVIQWPQTPPVVLLRRAGQSDIAAAIAGSTASTMQVSADLTNATHGWWDVVLINQDGGTATLSQAVFVDQPPAAGPAGCLQLSSGSDYAQGPVSATYGTSTTPLTLECWFRTSTPANNPFITALWNGITNDNVSLNLAGRNLIGESGYGQWSPTTAVVTDGAWHHGAIVLSGGFSQLYLDGVLASIVPGGPTGAGRFMTLGASSFTPSADCEIAEVRLWGAALPAGVIADWRGSRATPAHPYWSSLLAEYRCDDGSGTQAIDSAQGLNAVFSGAPQWQPGMVFASGTEDTPLSGTCASADPDGDPVSVQVVSQPTHGAVVLDPVSGAYTYSPDPGWYGSDAFAYVASDGWFTSAPTQVSIFLVRTFGHPALAEPGVLAVPPGVAEIGTLACENSDDLPVTFAIATPPVLGTVQLLDPSVGLFLYTPDAGAMGTDTFTFTVNDGTSTSPEASETVSIDQVGYPLAVINLGPTDTAATILSGTIICSAPLTGLTISSLLIANGQIANFTGSGASYSFQVVPLSAGLVEVLLPAGAGQDAHGDPTLTALASVNVDWTAPTVTLVPAASVATSGTPMTITAFFSEPVTALSLAAIGSVDATVTDVITDATHARITVLPGATGTLTLTLPAGAVTDLAGNPLTAASILVPIVPDLAGSGSSTSSGTTTATTSATGTDTDTTAGTASTTGSSTTASSTTASSSTGGSASQATDSGSTSSSGGCGLGSGGISLIAIGLMLSRRWRRTERLSSGP